MDDTYIRSEEEQTEENIEKTPVDSPVGPFLIIIGFLLSNAIWLNMVLDPVEIKIKKKDIWVIQTVNVCAYIF